MFLELLCYCLCTCCCVHLQLHQHSSKALTTFYLPPLDHPFVIRSYSIYCLGFFFQPHRLLFTYFETLYTMSLCLFLLSRILLATLYCLSFWDMLLLVLEWPISMNHLVNPFWDLWLYVFKTWHVRNFLGIMIHFSLCQKLKRGFMHHECLDGTFLDVLISLLSLFSCPFFCCCYTISDRLQDDAIQWL